MKNSYSWIIKILVISLVANLVLGFFFGIIIFKKGGLLYLFRATKSIFHSDQTASTASNPRKPKLIYTTRYFDRKSIYEALPDEENEIIFLGDSIIDDGEWGELFKDLKIKNRGIPGDRTDGVLKRIQEVVSSAPDKIFLMIGYNDLSRRVEIVDIVANYKKILQTIRSQSPRTKIYIQSVLPVKYAAYKGKVKNYKVRELNKELKQLSKTFNATYIDLFSEFCDSDAQLHDDFAGKDGLHLNGKAYHKWKSILEKDVYN
jgi:lysophospholipase L1-like esterase